MKLKCRKCQKNFEVNPNVDLMTDWHVLLGFDPECAKAKEKEIFNLIELDELHTKTKAPFFNRRVESKEILINKLDSEELQNLDPKANHYKKLPKKAMLPNQNQTFLHLV